MAFAIGNFETFKTEFFLVYGKRPKMTNLPILLYPRSAWVPSILRGVRSGAILVSVPGRLLLWMRKRRLDLKCDIIIIVPTLLQCYAILAKLFALCCVKSIANK